jgi:hypothetical protein
VRATLFMMAISLCLSGCTTGELLSHGIVREYDGEVRAPIPGVKITVDCEIGLIHGTRKIGEFHYVTDNNGEYGISGLRLLPCQFTSVHIAKDGWVDGGLLDAGLGRFGMNIPQSMLMVRQELVVPTMLRYWNKAAGALIPPVAPASRYEYEYSYFLASASIASTLDEVEFVRGTFCVRMSGYWNAMSEAEREAIRARRWDFDKNAADSYYELTSWCTGKAPVHGTAVQALPYLGIRSKQ